MRRICSLFSLWVPIGNLATSQAYFVSLQLQDLQQQQQQQQQQQRLQQFESHQQQTPTDSLSRRGLFSVSASFFGGGLVLPLENSFAVSSDDVAILRYPSIQYLVPIYNFQQALNYLEKQLISDNTNAGIQRALDYVNNFLKGGFLSNKNLLRSMCVVYIGEVQYDRNLMSPQQIASDQNDRLTDCDAVLRGIENMLEPLANLVQSNGSEGEKISVQGFLNESKMAMASFLSRIPRGDIDQVLEFMQAVKDADVDLNGKLSKTEITSLSPQNQEIYKIVGDLAMASLN